ncbi:hypothetical protein KIH86_01445 [Paenibacillus sp. HN-1]|uniref:hypothetical protein n=1 Tax=Paenibacillus TaxID=44249 RepID=UPI001CAA191F|nr:MULTISPECIES: hypothetical protein [Paenibacillus]MBY9079647.1 hypothetical protein [Paenibacillus sp. CGMCC 1.18879]MBY9082898.1 hypothetical protein [Paenibacillus sinensis]
MPRKYIGHTVEIVYLDSQGKLSQRVITVNDIRGGLVRASCLASGSPRSFRLDRILAWRPVNGAKAS